MAAAAAVFAAEPLPTEDGPDLTGWLVDARTGKPPLAQAIVHVAWTLSAGPETGKAKGLKQVVKEVGSIAGGRFYIVDWKRYVDARGWRLVPGKDPVVRIYAPGYRRIVIDNVTIDKRGKRLPVNAPDATGWKWVAENAVQELSPLGEGSAALAAELAQWRRDIDDGIAAAPAAEREAAIRDREKLLLLFDRLCGTLPTPSRVCYSSDSRIGRFVAERKAERSKYVIREEAGGKTGKYPFEPVTASKPQAQHAR